MLRLRHWVAARVTQICKISVEQLFFHNCTWSFVQDYLSKSIRCHSLVHANLQFDPYDELRVPVGPRFRTMAVGVKNNKKNKQTRRTVRSAGDVGASKMQNLLFTQKLRCEGSLKWFVDTAPPSWRVIFYVSVDNASASQGGTHM